MMIWKRASTIFNRPQWVANSRGKEFSIIAKGDSFHLAQIGTEEGATFIGKYDTLDAAKGAAEKEAKQ